jgi:hypothetical protein
LHNTTWIVSNDFIFHLYAHKKISRGEEITIDYVGVDGSPFAFRSAIILQRFGFRCACGACRAKVPAPMPFAARCAMILNPTRTTNSDCDRPSINPLSKTEIEMIEAVAVWAAKLRRQERLVPETVAQCPEHKGKENATAALIIEKWLNTNNDFNLPADILARYLVRIQAGLKRFF